MDERFEIDFKEFTCAVCLGVKVPYCTLTPCGHSLCATCSDQCRDCPECRRRIENRTISAQLADIAMKQAEYQCRSCDQSGDHAFAQQHRCDPLYNRFRPTMPDLDPDVFEAALDPFRQKPLKDVTDDQVMDVLLQRMEEQVRQQEELSAVRRRVQQVPPASNAGVQPPATGAPVLGKTIIFWDYDNINQSKCGRGVSTTAFLVKLVQFLKEKGVMPGSSWDAHAYFVNGVAYPENVIEACSKLQIERHLCSKKREAADRELQKNMRQAAEHRKATGSDDRIVLISDDGDFIETVKELANNFRCPVTVIHHAQGDHLLHLQAHAQATFDIAEIFPAFTGLSFAGGAGTTANAKAGTMVLVNNERHDVATLVPNRQVDFLIKNLSISGGMCRSTEAGHDAMKCKYVHKIASNANANAPAGTVNVEGNQVSVAGLVPNRATHYLLANPNKRGQYCSREDYHNPGECNWVHAKGSAHAVPPVAGGAQTVNVEGTQVPLASLLGNRATQFLQANPTKQGKYCAKSDAHDAATCTYVHRLITPAVAGTVNVEGTQVPLSGLLANRATQFLQANPTKQGKYCAKPNAHDLAACTFVHRQGAVQAGQAPPVAGTVNVEGTQVPLASLLGNRATQFLQANPTKQGKYCAKSDVHDSATCTYVHRQGVVQGGHQAPPVAGGHGPMINVEGTQVHPGRLVANRATQFLQANPTKQGKYCTKSDAHDAATCTYVHRL